MDIQNINVYTSYGECRCCLVKGHHRDITKGYYFNNILEVYVDIFKECFNLSLSSHSNISKLICSTCVQRLRDATSFRKMVLSAEKQLLLNVSHTDSYTIYFNAEETNNDIKREIKIETDYIEDNCSNNSIGTQNDCDMEFENHDFEDTKAGIEISIVDSEKELLARFKNESIPELPKICNLPAVCPKDVSNLEKQQDKVVKPKSIEARLTQPKKHPPSESEPKQKHITDKQAHIINATTILEFSNATAFKSKMRGGFPCFYCKEIYNPSILKEHQKIHPKNLLFKLLEKYSAVELVVYADVTDLKCTICDIDITNLNELKTHLIETHNKKMYAQYHDRVIPFKLKETDFECQVCGINFETFGSIERHMNSHYGNYICEECGAGFVTKNRLSIHTSSIHKKGNYPCDICHKVFLTQLKYKIHVDSVHKQLKKRRCPKCPESFIDYFERQRHLVSEHGAPRILYNCNVCDRGFDRKYSLNLHMKRTHLAQRDVKCKLCPYMCFSKTELTKHMVKHDSAESSQCAVCKKVFTKKKSLLNHMKSHKK